MTKEYPDPGPEKRGDKKLDPNYSKRENNPRKVSPYNKPKIKRRPYEHLSEEKLISDIKLLKKRKARKSLERAAPGINFKGSYFENKIKDLEEELEFRSRDEEMGEKSFSSWKRQIKIEEE